MKAFITVGSTGFDNLVEAATQEPFLDCLHRLGFNAVTIQYGSSEPVFQRHHDSAHLELKGYKYKADITEDMASADLIVSHAGSGSILQALRLDKRLVVMVNTSLMDNHQLELAEAMANSNYCIYANSASQLIDGVQKIMAERPTPFPDQTDTFARLLDDHMGY
ncbi:glycosyl transferase [Syncephalastrum racemosum]|uniref:UDP-N-acetylglucosamine transferase subunit ALG13 n=1 Tax=Syncephalastrum racemosum TaxID=13706 RepID=A0A1X2HCU0_SYNRA|nr:glycosyl transferase [Syncephalastrum racemosum]